MKRETRDSIITYLLKPASWLYWLGVTVRNKCFDYKILPSSTYDIATIGVGNITVGGTGKTPMVEYLIENLSRQYNIAVLSRGYKRHTKGFVLASGKSTPLTIGDEPYQIFQKYGYAVRVAVCESRCKGVEQIVANCPDVNLILLDDSFQHRYITPTVSIALMDYNRPVYEDKLLPLGRLREQAHAFGRAKFIAVTKCPENVQPLQLRLIQKNLNPMAFQNIVFFRTVYSPIKPVFPDSRPYAVSLSGLTRQDSALLLTGIANPRSFVRHFKQYPFRTKVSHFPDHHDFTRREISEIEHDFKKMKGLHKIIITTEKDAARLSNNPYVPENLKRIIYYLPMKMALIGDIDGNSDFIDKICKAIGAPEKGEEGDDSSDTTSEDYEY